MSTINNVTDDTFRSQVLQATGPVLVDFVAVWCKPCKVMEPIYAELAPEYAGRLQFVRIDADENPDAAATAGVTNLPGFVLFNNGRIVKSGFGTMRPRDFRTWIDEGLAKTTAARS